MGAKVGPCSGEEGEKWTWQSLSKLYLVTHKELKCKETQYR